MIKNRTITLGRMRVLEASKDTLPIHFALLDNEEAIGHMKLSRCLGTRLFPFQSILLSVI